MVRIRSQIFLNVKEILLGKSLMEKKEKQDATFKKITLSEVSRMDQAPAWQSLSAQ